MLVYPTHSGTGHHPGDGRYTDRVRPTGSQNHCNHRSLDASLKEAHPESSGSAKSVMSRRDIIMALVGYGWRGMS